MHLKWATYHCYTKSRNASVRRGTPRSVKRIPLKVASASAVVGILLLKVIVLVELWCGTKTGCTFLTDVLYATS